MECLRATLDATGSVQVGQRRLRARLERDLLVGHRHVQFSLAGRSLRPDAPVSDDESHDAGTLGPALQAA